MSTTSPPSQTPHTPLKPPTPAPIPTHLILLTCHSIYTSGPPTSPTSWLLAPFQKGGTEHLTFISHITLASSLLSSDPNALLVISGGYTRKEVRKSEARGYFEVGVERGLWSEEGMDNGRIILEEGALDSFGNLLRGLLAFWRGAGRWPGKVTVVSHGFKGERFLRLHCRALRVGLGRGGDEEGEEGEGDEVNEGKEVGKGRGVEVVFLGRNPSFMDPESAEFDEEKCEDTIGGEREKGYGEWREDLWGTGKRLRGKRDARDAWGGGMENGVDDKMGKERPLFESEEERVKSGLRTRWLEGEDGLVREEVILEGVDMPWEGER
ncbi:hypothetical protein SS1G_04957 [Sclerotinia sclerotiorum 1980 UF-70]|uniref:DUF218 domain-containing protein n=2 Tax=Sclerotinia sclerotiorum (strain ATCC 18683 / 1980 / Ss-1) TaxID=665079 RepID=A7EI15_SCLS1|nr:hypothetical protein SS1G_04957 [Sclerotinia sclerotiorum 1980 UF-70]APA11537.1 hypothetical protein sscle_08g063070 [Sclerotinia sclerotiorum 1980 UF-70]EDO02481.1 hypothetical protein SS1G_04957 [Sclerotinia sclerotiorum 1980 UF-70]